MSVLSRGLPLRGELQRVLFLTPLTGLKLIRVYLNFIIATARSLIKSRLHSWHDFYLQDGSGGKEIVNRYVTCLSL